MFDENQQNTTALADQSTQTTDGAAQMPYTAPEPTSDFPMINPNKDIATDEPNPTITQSSHPTYMPSNSPVLSSPSKDDDLMTIKKDALKQLSPLVDQLDQAPDEKFKTILMMIQASDDKSMISSAYEVAQKITDEKTKAQALLDIVNEINYFTQPTETE
jgi:hypothetical protein